MKKIIYFSLIVSILSAVEIKILPDKNISVSSKEMEATIEYFLQKHIKISKKDAEHYIRDNRILSNKFINEYQIPEDLALSLRLKTEEKLANLYVKKKQNNIKIDNDVIESYYKTHPENFIEDKKIEFIAYKFKNFNSALAFYQKNKIPDDGYEKEDITLPQKQINPLIAPLFEKTKEGEKTPPVFYGGNYVVFKIKKIEPSRRLNLQESKEKIKNILLQKIFLRTKKELLKNEKTL